MSIFNDLKRHLLPVYERTKENFFTAGENLAGGCLRISNQLSAGIMANHRPNAKINRIGIYTVHTLVLLLFLLNLVSLAYRITHVSTLAWAFTCTSFLGIPAFIYIVLPLTIALLTNLISALRLPSPHRPQDNDRSPMPFSHQMGLLCAAIIPFFFPMVFFITLTSGLVLLSAYKKIFKTSVSAFDRPGKVLVSKATITDKERQYYIIISYILLFHTAHVLVGSFPIAAAFSLSIVAASCWVGVLAVLTTTALIAPQYMYQLTGAIQIQEA